jgi:hypothetical protein
MSALSETSVETHERDSSTRLFIRGLLHPSLMSVLTALATAVLIIACVMSLSPTQVAAVIRWYTSYSFHISDDPAVCTSRALELSARPPGNPSVVILGASTTRESVDAPEISALLSNDVGRNVPAYNLTFSSQHIVESLALTDAIPAHLRGVVLVGVNPVRIGKNVPVSRIFRGRTLGFTSDSLREEARYWNVDLPQPTGWYAWDNRFFVLGLWRAAVMAIPYFLRNPLQPVAPSQHLYVGWSDPGDAWRQRQYEEVQQSLQDYAATSARHFQTLQRLIDKLQRYDLQVILLESPANPQFLATLPAGFYDNYRGEVSRFAQRAGVDYLDINAEAALRSADFYDWAHLDSAAAQQTYSATLARHLRHYFEQP